VQTEQAELIDVKGKRDFGEILVGGSLQLAGDCSTWPDETIITSQQASVVTKARRKEDTIRQECEAQVIAVSPFAFEGNDT
jgi:hypothetical protein